MNNQKTAIETVKRISLNVKPNRIGIHGKSVVILQSYLDPIRDLMQKPVRRGLCLCRK
jgi:hypothetical protein